MTDCPRKLRALPPAILCAAGLLGAGCYKTAPPDPFAREDPQVQLEGLAVVGAGAVGQFGMALSNTAALLSGRTPRYLEYARTLANPEAPPDALREAILGLAGYEYGRNKPYTDAYAQFARKSPHALVRASAVRALNIARNTESTPLFVEALADTEPRVRLEAAKALANIPSDEAIVPLIARTADTQENLDVRIAATDALRHHQSSEARRALVRLMEADDFSLAWQARRSLITSTGEDHGFDLNAWRRVAG